MQGKLCPRGTEGVVNGECRGEWVGELGGDGRGEEGEWKGECEGEGRNEKGGTGKKMARRKEIGRWKKRCTSKSGLKGGIGRHKEGVKTKWEKAGGIVVVLYLHKFWPAISVIYDIVQGKVEQIGYPSVPS